MGRRTRSRGARRGGTGWLEPLRRHRRGAARQASPLDYRLRQEEPDVGAEDPLPPAGDPIDETVGSSEQQSFDADVWGQSPPRIRTRRSRSTTTGSSTATFREPVGRLVEPDEGYGFDNERDSVAYDAGAAGGGASAEELAMHETNAPDYE